MKTWFHRIFLALIFTLTFAHVQVGVSVPNGLSSAQISVSVFDAAYANSCVANNPAGNWGTAGTWATCGGVAPTSADTCSITGTGTITVESAVAGTDVCGTTDFTGFTGTLAQVSTKELDIYGSLTIVSGMIYNPNSGAILKLKGTSSFTLATGGKNIPPMTVDAVGGTYTLQDTFATTTGLGNSGITITNGCFVTNNNTVTASLSSNNSNLRCLTLGTSTWNLNVSGVSGTWDITTPTNMTLSAASSTIVLPEGGGGNTFAGGGLTYGIITDTAAATGRATIGNFLATTLTISTGAGAGGGYKLSGNITVSGTCTGNGNSVVNRDYISSDTKGTARTFSCGTSTFTDADFQDITGAGAATWSLAAITGGSGNCGGNTGITFTTPVTAYLKTAVSVNWTAANWYSDSSPRTTLLTPQQFPLCQDSSVIDASSVTASGKTITIDASALRISAMNWTGVLNTPALAFTTAASYFGSITLVSGMTVSGTGLMTLEGRGSQNITTGTQVITPAIVINAPGGTWTQLDNLSSSRTSTHWASNAGTYAAGAFNTTITGSTGGFDIQGGTVTGSGTLSITGTGGAGLTVSSGDLNMPSATVSITGASSVLTLSGGTAEIGTFTRTALAFPVSGTALQLGTGGAAFGTITITSTGAIAPTTGNKITSVSSTAIAVSAAASGGGSCSFGDAGQWRDWNEANDNARRWRKAG